MPPSRRREHYRVDGRTGQRILVRAHDVNRDTGSSVDPDGDQTRALRRQALLLSEYIGSRWDPQRGADLPAGYTTPAEHLTATGHRPGRWWEAQTTLIEGQDASTVRQMPEQYSPSSARTGRRTHRIQYQFGDTKVRMPSRAAIGRFMTDNPALDSFDVPVEGLTEGRRGMGFIRLQRDQTTGIWKVTGGSAAFAGDSTFAEATRRNLDGIANRRRPRITRQEAQAATLAAQAAISADPNLGMRWHPMESSLVFSRIGHNPTTGVMQVEFRNAHHSRHGQLGTYQNITPDTFAEFLAADTPEFHFYDHIAEDPHHRVGGTLTEPAEVPAVNGYGLNLGTLAVGDQVLIENADPAVVVALGHDNIAAHGVMTSSVTNWHDSALVRSGNGTPYTVSLDALAPATPTTTEPATEPGSMNCPDCGQFMNSTRHVCPVTVTTTDGQSRTLNLNPDTGWATSDEALPPVLMNPDELALLSRSPDAAPDVLAEIAARTWRAEETHTTPLVPFTSPAIRAGGYDPTTRTLTLGIHGAPEQRVYENVPPEAWSGLLNAGDQDAYVAEHLDGHYDEAVSDRQLAVTRRSYGYTVQLRGPRRLRSMAYTTARRTLRVDVAEGPTAREITRYEFEDIDVELAARLQGANNADRVWDTHFAALTPARRSRMDAQPRTGPSRCRRCQQWEPMEGSHDCPGPSARTARAALASRVLRHATYSQHSQTATIRTYEGDIATVSNVAPQEFNRFLADPNTVWAAWRNGARFTDNDSHDAPSLVHTANVDVQGRGSRFRSSFLGIDESLNLPARTHIRRAVRAAEHGFLDVPVESALSFPGDSEIADVEFSGHVRVTRTNRGRLVATDNGNLRGGTPEQRAELVRVVQGILTAQRVGGSFQDIRQATLGATDLLRGRAEEAERAAEAARRQRAEAERIEAERVARETAEREAHLAEARARQEQVTQQLRARYENGAPGSWSESPERFQQIYEQARASAAAGENPVPYLRENALDGLATRESGRGFGIEVEFNFNPGVDERTARANILREMREEGLLDSQHPNEWLGYYAQRSHPTARWKCTNDSTVAGEIVSPVLYDEPETWAEIEKLCAIVRRNGGNATMGEVGNHVHVSCGDFDDIVENHNRLLQNARACGDDLYRLAGNRERGSHRGTRWCNPTAPLPVAGYSRVGDARNSHGHSSGVNFQSVVGQPNDHVEFRMWDGTLDPAAIQTHIKLSVALTAGSLAGQQLNPEDARPVGTARAANPRGHRLEGDEWENQHRGVRALLDKFFTREIDKAQIAAAWSVGRWVGPRPR